MSSIDGFISCRNSAIALLILLIHLQPAECQKSILDSTFTFRAGTVKTVNALSIITRETGYNFTYDSRLINPEIRIEMTFSHLPLRAVLNGILKSDSLVYSVIDKYIIISKAVPSLVPETDTIVKPESFYISGLIVDNETLEPLPFATIGIKNKLKGTVTNSNGEYSIYITPDCLNDTLYVSYLGYIGREIPIEASHGNNLTIMMQKEFISIPEIIIKTQVPQEIIYKTLSAIPKNYGTTPAMLTGFYREGVMKKSKLQSYSEAILNIYKSAYNVTLLGDQIKVLKSRKIENVESSDTLAVRLKAGLSSCLELDGVKNIFDFINRENIPDYTYRITDIVSYDEEAAYVIDFEQREDVENALFRGSVYINTVDFAILQADFELHPKYINKMKDSFVSSSSRKFTTKPVSYKYSVSYRKVGSRYFLSHVRGDLVFISKQKRKLFNSQFNVFFELAITGSNLNNVSRFEREELAPIHSVFTKTINSYDPGFWENQDFLKPEDNLMQALKNMKVKLLEFSDQQN
jgi:hypothetical protein